MDGEGLLTEALLAIDNGELAAARPLIDAAAAGGSLLARVLGRHLDAAATGSVYTQPAAFEAFIRGGGNRPLYAAVSAAWSALYAERGVESLLDIGCGDGLALIPALGGSTHRPGRLDLLEPSPALLDSARRALESAGLAAGRQVRSWALSAQDFAARLAPAEHWDLAQTSFAMQALPTAERATVLAALRPHVGALALVEFDVPVEAATRREQLASLVRRYETGIAEYADAADLVGGGFLAPMLLGQLGSQRQRSNWEQPATAWRQQLQAAGFGEIRELRLADYWWSPAFLLLAV